MSLGIVILAAGQGTRMKSSLPKVLHTLGDRPLVQHVIDTARRLSPERIVLVYGHGGEHVRDTIAGDDLIWAGVNQQPESTDGKGATASLRRKEPSRIQSFSMLAASLARE